MEPTVSLVYELEGKRIVFGLAKDEIIIGRAAQCDLAIPLASISRRHARIYRDGHCWRIADLGSKNGTRVNDLQEPDHALRHGDRIQLQDVTLTFADGAEGHETAGMAGAVATPLIDAPLPAGTQTVFRSAVDFSALARSGTETAEAGQPARVDRVARLVGIVTGASKVVLASKSLDEIFQKVLDLVFEYMPVQRGVIMLHDGDRGEWVTSCARVRTGSGVSEIRFSRTIAERVYRDKVAVLTRDALLDDRFAEGKSIVALGIRSAMAAPVWNGDSVEGLIYADTSILSAAFDSFDLDLLSALGNHLAVALEQSRLQKIALEKERLDRELSVARDIQMATLPRTMPALAGYEVAGASLPADQTGGDTFDLVPLADDRLVLLLGDATGHGVGPALSATQVRAMLRIALRLGADLDAAFTQINNQLAQDLADNRFVTAFLGLLDARAHTVRYHAGGQGPTLHFHAATGACEWHGATMLPLGFLPNLVLKKAETLELAPGDILGLMTDGVFESENAADEMFGTQRVADLIREHRDEPLPRLVELLLEGAQRFRAGVAQADDITIVLARRLAR